MNGHNGRVTSFENRELHSNQYGKTIVDVGKEALPSTKLVLAEFHECSYSRFWVKESDQLPFRPNPRFLVDQSGSSSLRCVQSGVYVINRECNMMHPSPRLAKKAATVLVGSVGSNSSIELPPTLKLATRIF